MIAEKENNYLNNAFNSDNKMKVKYILQDMAHFNVDQLVKVLPVNFTIEQNDKTYLTVELPSGANEGDSFFLLQKEIDRLFFLTGAKIKCELIAIEDSNGINTGLSNLRMELAVVKQLQKDTIRQQWNKDDITVHLRLWHLAYLPGIPLAAKINLLFQIIEIEYPNTSDDKVYIPYLDSKNPPAPKTEAKLLRHLMSHGKNDNVSKSLEQYCIFLGIKPGMHNPVDRNFINCVKKRLPVLIDEARNIINKKITKI